MGTFERDKRKPLFAFQVQGAEARMKMNKSLQTKPFFLSQNPAWPFLHIKQTISRDICKPNSLSPSQGLLNCQSVPSSGDRNIELRLANTFSPHLLSWKNIFLFSSKCKKHNYFVLRLLCWSASTVFLIVKPRSWSVFVFKPLWSSCMHHKVFWIQTWTLLILYVQYVLLV